MVEYSFQTRVPLPQTVEELHERIEKLTAVKDALDKELAILLGYKPEWRQGTPWHCLRCGHKWLSRLPHQPKQCAMCKSYKFDTPPRYTYEERVARKKSLKAQLDRAKREFEREQKIAAAPLPHSVMTRTDVAMMIPKPEDNVLSGEKGEIGKGYYRVVPQPVEDISTIELKPPPAPMSLRERLAAMKQASEEELVQAINGETDAT